MVLFNPPSFPSPESLVRLCRFLCTGRPRGTLRLTELSIAPEQGFPRSDRGLCSWTLSVVPQGRRVRCWIPGGGELSEVRGGSVVSVFTLSFPFQPEDTHQPPGCQQGRAAGRTESRWAHFFLSLSHLWLFILLRLEIKTAKPNRFFRGNVTLPGTVSPFFWLPDRGKN